MFLGWGGSRNCRIGGVEEGREVQTLLTFESSFAYFLQSTLTIPRELKSPRGSPHFRRCRYWGQGGV